MASGTVGVLRALLTADNAQFNAAFAESSKRASIFAVDLAKTGASAQQMGQVFTNALDRSLASVTKLAKEFSGAGIAKTADETAAAVARVGGASTLTASQQTRVNAVMTEALAKYKALGVEAPAHLLTLEQATRKAATASETFGSTLKTSFTNLGPQIASTAAGMITGLFTVQALQAGFHELTAFVGECITAFQKQEVAAKHVEAALRSAGTFTPALAAQYDALASEFEKTTVNADELNSEAIAMFTSLGEVGPGQMKRALQGASDLSAALGIDLMSAVELISKGLTGSSERLKKLTGDFDDAADKGQKLDNMLGAINNRFGGRAAADIQTTSGQLKQAANAWDNIKEAIGGTLLQNPQVQNAIHAVNVLLAQQAVDAKKATEEWEKYLIRRMEAGQGLPKAKTFDQDIALPKSVPQASATEKLSASLRQLVKDIAAVPSATKAAIIEGDRLGTSTKDLSDKLTINENIIKGVVDAHKKATASAKDLGKASEQAAKEIQSMVDQLTGAKLQAEIDKIAAAVTQAGGAEKITTAEGEKLVKQLREMESQGGRLNPVLQTVVARFQNWTTAGIKVQLGLGPILKMLPDLTKEIQDDQKAIDKQEAAWAKLLQTVPGLPPEFLKLTKVDIKKWGVEGADGAKSLQQSLDSLVSSFAQMSQIGGDSFGGVAKSAGTAIAALGMVTKAVGASQKAFGDLQKNVAGAGAAAASAALGWVSAFIVVGQAISKYWGKQDAIIAFENSFLRANNLAREFAQEGLTPTGLLAGLDASRAALEKLMPHGTAYERLLVRLGAEALNLTAIIDALGGISASSLIQIEDRAGRLFDLIRIGGPTGAAAARELNDVLQRMGQYFTDNGGIWDDTFRNMVARAKELGIAVEGVNALLQGQQDKLVSGANGVTSAIGKQAATYKELKKAVDDATKDDDPKKLADAQDKLSKAVVTTQGEFDRLSRIELAAFNTLVASGVGSVEAMGQVGAGIDALIANADAFGLSGNAAFEELKRWRELTTNNAELLSQIGSLNDLLVASANLGALTTDGLADMEAQGLSTYGQLLAAFTPLNASEEEANQARIEAETAMKPLLETIIKLHEERGIAIDEETQKLIEQARADGVLKAASIDSARAQLDILAAIAVALGATLPDSYKKLADAAKRAAEDTQKAWDGVQIDPIPIEFQYHTTGEPPNFAPAGDSDQPDYPGFASGTLGKLLNFGKGTNVTLHGWEGVFTAREAVMPQLGGSYLPQGPAVTSTPAVTSSGADLPPIITHTYLDGRLIARSTAPKLPRVLRNMQVTRT